MDLQRGSGQREVGGILTYEQALKLVDELSTALREAQLVIRAQAQRIQLLEEEVKLLKKKLYGSSSERAKKPAQGKGGNGSGKKPRVRSLTEQYPHAEVENQYIDFNQTPTCPCCRRDMIDSGLTEVSEQLHTVPAKHKIIRQHRRKYKCSRCYTGLVTAPLQPRVAPGSSLGDSFIIEAGIAKFYHLIPAERYAAMISQSGLEDFPPQLVLAAQHYLAEFLRPVYVAIRKIIQNTLVLFADETTHRMLEGSETKSWFLWGFVAEGQCYFEVQPTRSGDVAIAFLLEAQCVFLMSDVYTGYGRAIREINVLRKTAGRAEIVALFCNSHSRRRFTEASIAYPEEAQFFIDQYEAIYRLESELKVLNDPQARIEKRSEMRPFFEAMARQGSQIRDQYSDKSSLVRAVDYFINHYDGLTRFLQDPALPIDNNISERQLRSPVIGRKTWYGTHSEQGNETTEILFTILQSCRLLRVDPRRYLTELIQTMHHKDPPFTPAQYVALTSEKKTA